MIAVKQEVAAYKQKLGAFVNKKQIPYRWLEHRDHVAFKAYNPEDYELLVEQFKPLSMRISEVHLDGRRLAAARLIGQYGIDMMMGFSLGPNFVYWVELMEARPTDQSDEPPSFDHEELLSKDLDLTARALRRREIKFEQQSNASHSWLSIKFDDVELKLSDRALQDIVEAELATGQAQVIYQRPTA